MTKTTPKWLIWGFCIISFLGFLDTTYLTFTQYLKAPLVCPILTGCDKVLTSQYAFIAGIPLTVFGAIYYLTIFLLTLTYSVTKREIIMSFTAILAFIGFLVSIRLLYLQFFVIEAFCIYCIFSVITSTVLFVFGIIWFLFNNKKKTKNNIFQKT